MRCQGSNLGQLPAKQMAYPLYYPLCYRSALSSLILQIGLRNNTCPSYKEIKWQIEVSRHRVCLEILTFTGSISMCFWHLTKGAAIS